MRESCRIHEAAYKLWRREPRRPRCSWSLIASILDITPERAHEMVRSVVLLRRQEIRGRREQHRRAREAQAVRRAARNKPKPKAYREMLRLFPWPNARDEYIMRLRLSGKTYRAIGEIVGLSIERVRQLYVRANKRDARHAAAVLKDMNSQLVRDRNYLDIGRPLPRWKQ